MGEWFQEPAVVAFLLVGLSVLGLVGGSFSGGGVTLDLRTARGKVNLFIMLIGATGLLMILVDFFRFL
jgi:hypothetical protein